MIDEAQSTHALLIDLLGEEEASRIVATAQARKERAELTRTLDAYLADVRQDLGAKIAASRRRVDELQDEVNRAYSGWIEICTAFERAKTELHQNRSKLRELVQAILAAKNTTPIGPPLIQQWSRPSWYRPESERKSEGADGN